MLVDVLPNLVAPIIVLSTLLIPIAIAFESTLTFLGAGIDIRTPSWGGMLAECTQYYRVAWWYLVVPSGLLLLTTLAFNLLGDGIRDALDPRGDTIRFRRDKFRRRFRKARATGSPDSTGGEVTA
jgi:ABC-type dipeptide/oligopeptide/nickel transport system permease subunit